MLSWNYLRYLYAFTSVIQIATWIVSYYRVLMRRYGKERMSNYDSLNIAFFRIKSVGVSLGVWSLFHFVAYLFLMLAGFPSSPKWGDFVYAGVIFIFGASWELIEDLISRYNGKRKDLSVKHQRRLVGEGGLADSQIVYSDWWAGTFNDIVVNTLGMILGMGIRMVIPSLTIPVYVMCIMIITIPGFSIVLAQTDSRFFSGMSATMIGSFIFLQPLIFDSYPMSYLFAQSLVLVGIYLRGYMRHHQKIT